LFKKGAYVFITGRRQKQPDEADTDVTKEVFAENFVNHSAPANAPTDLGAMIKFVTD